MADEWKKKLRQLKTSMEPKKGLQREEGGQRTVESVDPKAIWGRSRDSQQPHPGRPSSAKDDLPPEPEAGSGSAFNIGIDVGTSTLKVCVRPPGLNSRVHLIQLGTGSNLLCPSVVAIESGRTWFGEEAVKRIRSSSGQIFRQLKVCVACEIGQRPEVPASACRCERMKDGTCSAIFSVLGTREGVLASDLLTLLLSWAMSESRQRIPADLLGDALPRTTYSVSAPVDQIDAGSQLNREYARIAFQAWRLSGGIQQGVEISRALRWIKRIQQEPLPSDGDRLVELCPESSAIVAGYAMSPEIEEGQYAIVDIGAWTTEMAFFRFTEVGRRATGRPAKAFHVARSHRVAANQIDDRCRNHVLQMYAQDPSLDPTLAEVIRGQRERRRFGNEPLHLEGRIKDVQPRPSGLLFARDLVAEEIGRRFFQTLSEAYQKEKFESMWVGQLRIMLAGGGSLDTVLSSGICHAFIRDIRPVPQPSDLLGLSQGLDYRRFLVAYGLAQGSARWPRDLLPSQTLPFKPTKRSMPSSEELGYVEP